MINIQAEPSSKTLSSSTSASKLIIITIKINFHHSHPHHHETYHNQNLNQLDAVLSSEVGSQAQSLLAEYSQPGVLEQADFSLL